MTPLPAPARQPAPTAPTTALLLLAAAGCAGYEPEPLDAVGVVEQTATWRNTFAAGDAAAGDPDGVTLADALGWLREHSPELRARIADWRAAHARAEVRTPWPDPQLALGPRLGFGDDPVKNEWTAFGQVTLGIPLGDRRDAADARDRARAEELRTAAILAARDLHLRLRGGLARLALSRTRRAEFEALAADAERAAELARRGVDAGTSSALDVALAELEAARTRGELLAARELEARELHVVARLAGVPAARFAALHPSLLPELPTAPPPREALRATLARNNPELVRHRAQYAVAEQELRLQTERQYPDLQLGPNYTGENPEDVHVLQFGVQLQLPLFDGNRKAIASARARREALQQGYDAAANRALGSLDDALAMLEAGAVRRAGFREAILPLAERHAELARRSVRAGTFDALRAVQVERSARRLRTAALDAELDQLERWLELERVVGAPLLELGTAAGEDAAEDPGDDAATDPTWNTWPAGAPTDASDPDAARTTLGPFRADATAEENDS